MLGELSLACDALSFRSIYPDANGWGTMELVGVTVANVAFAAVAFANLGNAFAVFDLLDAFAS